MEPNPEADIRDWVKNWNDNSRPFVWTQNRRGHPRIPGRLMKRINGVGH